MLHPISMPTRALLQLVLLIALVLAPICGMSARAMAMPIPDGAQAGQHHGTSAESGHCVEMREQQEDDGSDRGSGEECRMMGCTGVLANTPPLDDKLFVMSSPKGVPVSVAALGLNPAAEPRPPRLS